MPFTFDLNVVVHHTDPLLPKFDMGTHCWSSWVEFCIKAVIAFIYKLAWNISSVLLTLSQRGEYASWSVSFGGENLLNPLLHPFYWSPLHHLHPSPSSNRPYALPLERLVELKWACSSYCSTSFQRGHTLLRFPEQQATRKPVGMCCLLAPGRLQNCTRCKNNSNSISSCPKNRTNHKAHNCAGMFVLNTTGGFTEEEKKKEKELSPIKV